MSLPAGFLDELRARASIAQVAGRKVSWDQKKTNINKELMPYNSLLAL